MPELLDMLSRDEKETLVLFPETHTREAKLLGAQVTLRPLSISASKKISMKVAPLSAAFEKLKAEPDAGSPDLDLNAIDTLLDCVMIIAQFYRLDTITRERLEEEVSPEELLAFLNAQLSVNRENNFLLQNLRAILRIVDLSSLVYLSSLRQLSTLPGAEPGESPSGSSQTTTPPDSLSSSTGE